MPFLCAVTGASTSLNHFRDMIVFQDIGQGIILEILLYSKIHQDTVEYLFGVARTTRKFVNNQLYIVKISVLDYSQSLIHNDVRRED